MMPFAIAANSVPIIAFASINFMCRTHMRQEVLFVRV
jgi:hypothetical protein